MNSVQDITSVVTSQDGNSYIVNGTLTVPMDAANRHYVMVQQWITAGNTPSTYWDSLSLADAQTAQISTLYSGYLTAIDADVSFTSAGGVTKMFQCTDTSRSNLHDMITAFKTAGAPPTGFYWVSSDNTQVPFTYADLEGLAEAFGNQGWTNFQHLQTQKTAVLAATTNADVAKVVW